MFEPEKSHSDLKTHHRTEFSSLKLLNFQSGGNFGASRLRNANFSKTGIKIICIWGHGTSLCRGGAAGEMRQTLARQRSVPTFTVSGRQERQIYRIAEEVRVRGDQRDRDSHRATLFPNSSRHPAEEGSHHLRDFFLRDIPSARHLIFATSHLCDFPFSRLFRCVTFQLRDIPFVRLFDCATSHLRDIQFA